MPKEASGENVKAVESYVPVHLGESDGSGRGLRSVRRL